MPYRVGDRVYFGEAGLRLFDYGQRNGGGVERVKVDWRLLKGKVTHVESDGVPWVKWAGIGTEWRHADLYDLHPTPEAALEWARECYRSEVEEVVERWGWEFKRCKWPE